MGRRCDVWDGGGCTWLAAACGCLALEGLGRLGQQGGEGGQQQRHVRQQQRTEGRHLHVPTGEKKRRQANRGAIDVKEGEVIAFL